MAHKLQPAYSLTSQRLQHVLFTLSPLSSNRQHYEIDDWRISGKIIRTTIVLISYARV